MFDIIVITSKKLNIKDAVFYTQNDGSKDVFCDILLCMPDVNPTNFKIETNFAILCGDYGFSHYKNIKAKNIITYGLSSKNTVTISSFNNEKLLVCVQREILNIKDKKIEIGEKLVNINYNPLYTLGIEVLNIIMT